MIREWNNNSQKESEFIKYTDSISKNPEEKKLLVELAPYFSVVPNPVAFASKFINYGSTRGYSMIVLSDTARHHLYDSVLYEVA